MFLFITDHALLLDSMDSIDIVDKKVAYKLVDSAKGLARYAMIKGMIKVSAISICYF